MNRGLHVAILLSGLWAIGAVQGEPARYQLNLSGHDPKAGDEGERIVQMSSAYNSTDTTVGQASTSNSLQFVELKGREKVVTWDVSNDVSKVEMVVEHLVEVEGMRTNELLKSGSKLVGNSLAGESFFRVGGGTVSAKAQGQLARVYSNRPRKFNQFAQMELPPSVAIGETWKLATPMEAEALSVLGASYTNGVEATGQLVAITNFFGIDCFHIRLQVVSTNTPEFVRRIFGANAPVKMDMQVRFIVDLIAPKDTSQRILSQSLVMDITGGSEVEIDGGPKKTSRSRMTSKYLDEFRPIPHLAGSGTKSASSAVESGNFDAKQIDDIWTAVWKSADPKTVEPKLEKISEADVVERMLGKWTVMVGVIPDKLTIALHADRQVEVSGQKDGTAWKKAGQWRVASDKLVLFMKEDSLPSFIFRTRGKDYIFDPWAKTMMSELKREK